MAYMVSIVQPNKHSNLAKQRVNSCDNFSKWCIFWKQSSPWGSGLSLFQHGPESRGPCLETKGNGIFNKKKKGGGPSLLQHQIFQHWPPRSLPATSKVQCSEMPHDASKASSSRGQPASSTTWSSTRRPSRVWTWAWHVAKQTIAAQYHKIQPRDPTV